ncbi:MAG TPA: amidase [Solirubrobacterales bacterium]|nr:amidase [Solirubrobacterales bacterium]
MQRLETDPALWPATALAAAIARRELSPVEAMAATIARVERCEPDCNAFVDLRLEEAMERAGAAEAAVARGEPVGPLHGVPFAIKDLSDAKRGWRHTRGSRAFADCLAAADSPAVARLEAAGAIALGTANSSELGHKSVTDNELAGPTSSPRAPGRNAGGSSGGSAAAVAAGMAALATGSDGAGSLRVPASACGVFTLKPSFGSVPAASRPNGFRSAWPMAQGGVLTRSVADAALALDLLCRPHRADPLALPPPARGLAAGLGEGSLAGLRVGLCLDWGGFPIEADVLDALAPFLADLERMGARVEPEGLHRVPVEDLGAAIRRGVGLALADLVETDIEPARRSLLEATTRELAAEGAAVSGLQLRRDERLRTALFDRFQAALERHDVLVGPAVGVAAVANGPCGRTVGPSRIAGRAVDPLLGWSPAFLVNLTGHPAACVPGAETADGVPVGLQVVGPRLGDRRLLAICAAIERERPW